ncbi:MAG: GNAT family N-acetyltransferase [Thermoguttaceae bacterium]
MAEITVRRVSTRRQRRDFLTLPWTLYRDDPHWIPPLRDTQKEGVGYRSNPFYDRNRIQTFVAYRDGQACGRIGAILNYGHIERYQDLRGFFGFFESVEDQAVADALFDAARDWLAGQGIYKLRGPTNPSLNYEVGLLVDGFDSSPTFMMTYNPPYYARLYESYGFRKAQDLYAFWGHISMLPKVADKLAPVAQQIVERYKALVRPLDPSRFIEEVKTFLSIYNRSLTNTWGFVPMSDREMTHIAKGLQHLIVPELAILLEVDGRPVGATFGLLDYNPRIKEIDGRLFPFGFIHLLRNKRQIKRIRLISTNVLPEFQLHGLGMVLLAGVVPKALEWGMEEAEFSWVLESNNLSRGALQKGGAKITKTYRVYDLEVPPAAGGRSRATLPTGPLEVRPVQSRRDVEQFLRVPWPIYAHDPQWVPPLLLDQKEFLDRRKHPFYKHGAAAQFVAWRGNTAVGRILASDDPRYNQQQQTNLGCFGMFESIDDPPTAHALLEAAAGWLRQRGRSAMLGPIDYSLNYPCGLLVEGFHTPPRVMDNHNPPYYAALLESWGLAKAKDLYSWWFTDPLDIVAKWRPLADRIQRRGRLVIRPFRKADFHAEVLRCQAVYNQSMQNNWGFVSLSEAEFHYMSKRLAELADPNLVLLAEVDGQPVGFSITLPDINEAIRPLDGRLTRFGLPINLVRFLYRRRHIQTGRMIVLDVLEKYRRRGVAEMLILRTLDYAKNTLGFTAAELGWTLEDNTAVNRVIEAVGGWRYKVYRIFTRAI